MAVTERRRWLRQLIELAAGIDPNDLVVAVAARVGGDATPTLWLPADLPDPINGWADPWLIGAVQELLATAGERSTRGAWYTPQAVVEQLVSMAMPPMPKDSAPTFVLDPTCGGGAFLLAALDRLVAFGLEPSDALVRIGGIDIDEGAVHAARLSVGAWGRLAAASVDSIRIACQRICVGDQLLGWPEAWPDVEVVLGNPPFATPLRGQPLSAAAQQVREERRDRLGPYADLAAIHLAVCVERVVPGGRVCLVLPQSLLAGRDTADLRCWIESVAPMADIWATAAPVFDAAVRVWSPLLIKSPGHTALVTASPGQAISWSEAAAGAIGVPTVHLRSAEKLGSLLTSATAGFRDEFYALADACVELGEVSASGELPDGYFRLATVGSLDPLVSWWGQRPTRFAKQMWHEPVVESARVEGKNGLWLSQMAVPKVLLPTQSRIFEPFVDRDGTIAPATPLLALHADPDAIDLVAAVLLAPQIVAWAFAQWFGAALSVDAIKVAARDLASFPLPPDRGAWNEAAAIIASADGLAAGPALRRAIEAGTVMHRAYGRRQSPDDDDAVLRWWHTRAEALVASEA